MADFPQGRPLLVTGAGGRLGRLLQQAEKRDAQPGEMRLCFQSRRPAPGGDGGAEAGTDTGAHLQWQPGDPESALPKAQAVLALWGVTSGDAEALAANVSLVAQSLAVARACGADRVFHLSTAAVYAPGQALSEAAPCNGPSPYGQSKVAMEQAVAALPADDGIRHCCLRLANVVGADSLAPALRDEGGSGPARLDRFADGRGPRRSYITASDLRRVVLGLAALPESVLPAALNVAAPAVIEMEALLHAAGREIAHRPAPQTAVQEVTLDARRLTGLLPGTDLHTEAAAMIADWRELEPDA